MGMFKSIKDHKLKSAMIIILLIFIMLVLFLYSNKVAPISWGLYGDTNNDKGVAIMGADAVAYFSEAKYIQGDPNISVTSKGTTWHFSSEMNKQLFETSPEKYMPQYGGYCAFAVSKNVTAIMNPEFWTIENDKLYLFNDESVKEEWINAIGEGSLTTADTNWSARK